MGDYISKQALLDKLDRESDLANHLPAKQREGILFLSDAIRAWVTYGKNSSPSVPSVNSGELPEPTDAQIEMLDRYVKGWNDAKAYSETEAIESKLELAVKASEEKDAEIMRLEGLFREIGDMNRDDVNWFSLLPILRKSKVERSP